MVQLLPKVLPRQGTQPGGRVERVADLELRSQPHESLLVLVGDGLGHQKALGGDARLARVLKASLHADLGSLLKVGVLENQEEVRAAQLHDSLLDLSSRDLGDPAPGHVAAGERDPAHPRVGDQSRDRVGAGDESSQATVRESRLSHQSLQCQGGAEAIRRVLKYGSVSGHQGGSGKPQHLPEGVIPGHDRQDHSQGPEGDEAARRVGRGRLIGEEALRLVGEILT